MREPQERALVDLLKAKLAEIKPRLQFDAGDVVPDSLPPTQNELTLIYLAMRASGYRPYKHFIVRKGTEYALFEYADTAAMDAFQIGPAEREILDKARRKRELAFVQLIPYGPAETALRWEIYVDTFEIPQDRSKN